MRVLTVVHPDDKGITEVLRARGAEVREVLFVRPETAAEIATGGWDAVIVSEYVDCEGISLDGFLEALALRARARIKLLLDPDRRPGDPLIRKAISLGIREIMNQVEFTAEELWELVTAERTLPDVAHLLGSGGVEAFSPQEEDVIRIGPRERESGAKAGQALEKLRSWARLAGLWVLQKVSRMSGRKGDREAPDPLTGLPGRTAAEALLRDSLESGRGAAVVFVDLDGFKEINDTQGHAEGDRVLRKVAKVMSRAVRRDDLLCRWGGDEFVLVMPGADLITAQEAAERLRGTVFGIIGVSVGVAVSRPGDTVESLVHRADRAMYEDKRGRKAGAGGLARVCEGGVACAAAGGALVPLPVPACAAPGRAARVLEIVLLVALAAAAYVVLAAIGAASGTWQLPWAAQAQVLASAVLGFVREAGAALVPHLPVQPADTGW